MMAQNPDPKYQRLIIKYLSNQISTSEDNDLRHWVDQSEENAVFFDEIYELWEAIKTMPEAKAPAMGSSWKELEKELGKTQLGQKRQKRLGRFSLRMAVVLMGVMGVLTIMGYWITRDPNKQDVSFPEPDIYLDENRYSIDPSEDFLPIKDASIPLPQGTGSDSLFIRSDENKWIFSIKDGEILLRSSREQALIRPGEELVYLPEEGLFID